MTLWAPAARAEAELWSPARSLSGVVAQDQAEAQRLLGEKKWAEAAIVLRSILNRGPAHLQTTLDLVRALTYSGRREEALSVLGQAASREKKGVTGGILLRRLRVLSRFFLSSESFQIYQDGLNLLRLDKRHLAKERFEKVLEREPDNAEVLLRLGQCLVLDRDYDSAAERLRLAKRLDPNEPEIFLWLGRALYRRGEQKAALSELRQAYRSLESSERAPLWYAEALAASGQKYAAIQLLEKNSRSHPFHLNAMLLLVRFRTESAESLQNLWAARKDLQLIISRAGQSLNPGSNEELAAPEGELGIDLPLTMDQIKEEATKFLGQVDGKIQKLQNKTDAPEPRRE